MGHVSVMVLCEVDWHVMQLMFLGGICVAVHCCVECVYWQQRRHMCVAVFGFISCLMNWYKKYLCVIACASVFVFWKCTCIMFAGVPSLFVTRVMCVMPWNWCFSDTSKSERQYSSVIP